MTFVELKKSNFDNSRIKVFPQQHFTSGSSLCLNTDIGEFGCVPAVRTRSKSIKEIDNKANSIPHLQSFFTIENNRSNSSNLNHRSRNHGFVHLSGGYPNIERSQSDNYFFKISRNVIEYRNPESVFDKNNNMLTPANKNDAFGKKLFVKNVLYNKNKLLSASDQYYNYGFSNYNTLNFFTLGAHPDHIADSVVEKKTHKTCVIYPSPFNPTTYALRALSGLKTEYTISFWLNPRRTNVNGFAYNIGTILAIPGLINVYLAKGSSIDEFGYTDKFRLLVDVGPASYNNPNAALLSSSTGDILNNNRIVTDDNILDKNKWYYISIVKKNDKIIIYLNGESITDTISGIENIDPTITELSTIMYVGNKHVYGTDTVWKNNFDRLYDYYFGSDIAEKHGSFDNKNKNGRADAIVEFAGLPQFEDGLDTTNSDSLALNAELADIRIYSTSRLSQQIKLDMKSYVNSLKDEFHLDLIFYVPLYFVPEKVKREVSIIYGTLSELNVEGPINPYLSHRILGHEVNIGHFLNDFVRKLRPFVEGVDVPDLSGTDVNSQMISYETVNQKINKAFLEDASTKSLRQNNHILRNHLILSNDNGLTEPSWSLIEEVYPDARNFVYSKDIYGNYTRGLVSLNEIIDIRNLEKVTSQSSAFGIGQEIVSDGEPRSSNFPHGSLYRTDRKPYDEDVPVEIINLSFNVRPELEFDLDKPPASFLELGGDGLILDNFIALLSTPLVLSAPSIYSKSSPVRTLSTNQFSTLNRSYLLLYEMTSYLGDTYGPIIEIPNAFYSEKIKEETIILEDKDIAGTAGALQMKFKDNIYGGMYRADCLTPHADWNYVGHVFRNEGFISLLHPSLASFGELSYDIKFKGEHGLNVFEINVPISAGENGTSLNKSYKNIKPTNYNSDHDIESVFIDTINLHDENLNIVAKANLSKPLSKRVTDKYNFRFKLDY